jgi:predicted Rossmann-fold nucleotide-binding protein
VKRERGRTIEVDSVEELDQRVEGGARSMDGWHLRALDLSGRSELLARLSVCGALFLGCRFADARVENDLRARGALLFPTVPDVPIQEYRPDLYSPHELYDGLEVSYEQTPDARIYAWSKQSGSVELALAKALHDHAIDEALTETVVDRDLVGMMGGHAMERGTEEYAGAARLARGLAAQGLFVCTGGGPGAMEAANLGAYLSTEPPAALDAALATLAQVPSFRPSVEAWARAAFRVLAEHPDGTDSLGIPTWHYGHEPPNPFATRIAKYFKNAIREDVLLHLCTAGIIFLPGSGGTVQEIFQDACENYYADPASVAPMVLVGQRYWTETYPAWPLLEALSRGRAMEPVVHLVDSVTEAAAMLSAAPLRNAATGNR